MPPEDLSALRVQVFVDDVLRRVVAFTGEMRIGRGADNELVLEDAKISRAHAILRVSHGRVWIEDLDSANGVFVNGRQVDRAPVTPADAIELGPFKLTLTTAAAEAQVEPQTQAGAGVQDRGLGVLLELLESLDGEVPAGKLLDRVMASLLAALGGERAYLYRYDTRHKKVEEAGRYLAPDADASLPVSTSLVGKVARDREPCLVTDLLASDGPEAPSLARLAAGNVQSVVITPLVTGRRLAGVLYVDSRATRRRFGTKELDLLSRTVRWLAGLMETLAASDRTDNENERLRAIAAGAPPIEQLVAPGSPFTRALELAKRAAAADVTVLLSGETGTGKEETANAIHRLSGRRAGPFVPINCGAIPEALVESELFGHKRGAFSGANEDRAGLVEVANGGTLFLDEVGDLPPGAQVKLLRVLQERKVQRVGASEWIPVDFRLVAASHRDLDQEVARGAFRQDLLYRLKVVSIELPALRERGADLPLIASWLVSQLAERMRSAVRGISPDAMAALSAHAWPGNVRELRNALERALVVEEGPLLTRASLPPEVLKPATGAKPSVKVAVPAPPEGDDVRPYNTEILDFDRAYFRRLRKKVGGNISAMARVSGLSRLTLYRKLGDIGITGDKED